MLRYLVAALFLTGVLCDLKNPAKVDLTPDQIALVKKSWEGPAKTPTDTGVTLFYEFFKAYPKTQQDFPKFKDVALSDLKALPAFRDHATKIFNIFGNAINNLGKSGSYGEVEKLSQYHADRSLTDRQKFVEFRGVLLNVLKVEGETKTAWNAFLDNFFNAFFSKF